MNIYINQTKFIFMSPDKAVFFMKRFFKNPFQFLTGRTLVHYPKAFLAMILCVCSSCAALAQEGELMEPRAYEAVFTAEEFDIDGRALEAAWQKAPFSESFIDIEGDKTPRYETRMKMMWGKEYFYFYAEMEEPHVWGTLKQRDTVIFYNNDFEIFMDPDGDTHQYYEFEMNALNTVWDLLLVKPYRNGGSVIDHWDMHGLRSAVYVDGSLNDPADEDKGWSIEVAIPWDVLKEAAGMPVPPEGEFWRINFSRVNWDFQLDEGRYSRKQDDRGNYLPEYNWVWSPQQVINMHEPERWGYVFFRPENSNSNFVIPAVEPLKWELYAVYRELRKNNAALLKKVQNGQAQVPVRNYKGKPVQARVEFHQSGWNLVAEMPGGNAVLIIKEDGEFVLKTK